MSKNGSECLQWARSENSPAPQQPKLVSLFCGAGGLDLGFIDAGFDVAFAADHDRYAVETYNHNHPGQRASKVDLLETSPEELYKRSVLEPGFEGAIHGIIGGPPCQGFSRANTARCHSDPRNQLAVKYADIVNYFYRHSKIKFFLFENVPEILAKKNADFLEMLRARLSKNFFIYEKEINSSGFGVAQHRRRYFIAGISKDVKAGKFTFPEATVKDFRTVEDEIFGFPQPVYYNRANNSDSIPFHPNHWTMKPKSKRFLTGEMPAGGRSFIKLDWKRPSRTVAYGNREIHVHPDGHRRLSIYEAMKLQGFPDSYRLMGTLSAQVKQISNAVPPPVAAALAKCFKEFLL